MKAKVEELMEDTMTKFIHAPNRGIQGVVELQSYHTLESLVYLATRWNSNSKKRRNKRSIIFLLYMLLGGTLTLILLFFSASFFFL